MQTSLRIVGANCSSCFNETLDALAHLDGVRSVRGSIAGPCIEIDHDGTTLDLLTSTIRDHLHGVEMFANEIRMVPLDPVTISTACGHCHVGERASAAPLAHANDIDPSMTLGEIVTRYPTLAAELDRRGLDYCCHGARTLTAAAHAADLDPSTVAAELAAARIDEAPAEWAALRPVDLADHIEAVHHRYLWIELPRISILLDRIIGVHGERHPELLEVGRLYTELRADFEPHLLQEEHVVFPMIRQLANRADQPGSSTAELEEQIEALAGEHETVGALLGELARATGGYATPADGCATYAACYRALAELQADTHLHVHKESNVLFAAPTFLRRWQSGSSTPRPAPSGG